MLVDDAGWLQAAHVDDDEDYDYDEDAGAEGGGGGEGGKGGGECWGERMMDFWDGVGGIPLGFVYGNCNLERIELDSDDDSSLSTRATSFIDSVLIQGKITVSRKCM